MADHSCPCILLNFATGSVLAVLDVDTTDDGDMVPNCISTRANTSRRTRQSAHKLPNQVTSKVRHETWTSCCFFFRAKDALEVHESRQPQLHFRNGTLGLPVPGEPTQFATLFIWSLSP